MLFLFSFSYNVLLSLPFSDISAEMQFFRIPSLRIFPGDDIIAKVERANPVTVPQSVPGIMAIPRTQKTGICPLLHAGHKKGVTYAL